MLIKILFIAALIFLIGRNILKLAQTPAPQKNNTNKKDDSDNIIDADYTVVDDDK